MSDLKTLKDIKGIYSNGSNQFGSLHTNTSELKKEAIKWVDELKKSDDHDHNACEGLCEWCESNIHKVDWIKQFFNINEKEDKE
jgi:hypothetical protein